VIGFRLDNGRLARGAGGLLAAQAMRLSANVLGLLLLARILQPQEFGVASLALVVFGVAEVVRDAGIGTTVLRAPSITRAQRDNLAWVSLLVGAVLAGLVFAAAGPVSWAFGLPGLRGAVELVSLGVVLNSVVVVHRAELNRSGAFTAIASVDATASVVGLGTAIAAANLGVGAVSLVLQVVAASATTMILVLMAARWFPRLPSRRSGVRPMLRFGFGFLVAQVISLIGNRADTLVLGLTASPASLGLYNRAYQLAIVTPEQMRSPLVGVALPGIQSRLDHPMQRIRFVLDGQLMLLGIFVPALMFLAACAPGVVELVLGPGWEDAAPIVAVLAVGAVFQQAAGTGSWLFISAAASTGLMRYAVISAFTKVAFVLVGQLFGSVGVAAGIAVAMVVMYPLAISSACRSAHLDSRPIFAQALRVIAVSGGGALLAVTVLAFLDPPIPALELAVTAFSMAIVGLVAYISSRFVRADFSRFSKGVLTMFRRRK